MLKAYKKSESEIEDMPNAVEVKMKVKVKVRMSNAVNAIYFSIEPSY